MPDEAGAHCRDGGMNGRSLGICLAGNFDLAPPVPEALELLVRLAGSLMRMFGIPPGRVYRHSDWPPYKRCPGRLSPRSEFMAALGDSKG